MSDKSTIGMWVKSDEWNKLETAMGILVACIYANEGMAMSRKQLWEVANLIEEVTYAGKPVTDLSL